MMADGHPTPEDDANAGVRVKDGAVLNVGLFSDDDLVRVSANDRVEPDAGLVLEDHGPDDIGRLRNEHLPFDSNALVSELIDHQSALPLNSTGE
jgi:hypothetical protein